MKVISLQTMAITRVLEQEAERDDTLSIPSEWIVLSSANPSQEKTTKTNIINHPLALKYYITDS